MHLISGASFKSTFGHWKVVIMSQIILYDFILALFKAYITRKIFLQSRVVQDPVDGGQHFATAGC